MSKFKNNDVVRRIICTGGNMRIGRLARVIAVEESATQGTKLVLKYRDEYTNEYEIGVYSGKYYEIANDIKQNAYVNTYPRQIFKTIIDETLPARYIINKGATILIWNDDSKTIVKKTPGDVYDKRLGFLYAYFQKKSGLSRCQANRYIQNLVDDTEKEETIDKNEETKEWNYMCKLYFQHDITGVKAARILGITKDAFYYRCKRDNGIRKNNRKKVR